MPDLEIESGGPVWDLVAEFLERREVNLKIDKDTGSLGVWKNAGNKAYKLTVEDEHELFDIGTGETITGSAPSKGCRTFELALGPGEGRLYYLGNATLYRRFLTQYKLDDVVLGSSKSKSAGPKEKMKGKTKTKAK